MTLSGNFFNLNGNGDIAGESSWYKQVFLYHLVAARLNRPLARGYLTQQKLTTAFEVSSFWSNV